VPSVPHVEVSVLVPVRNEAAGIRHAVAAMQGQRFAGGFELLFMDGRSDDGTRAILEQFAAEDDRIRVLDNPRRGIPQALNLGLRHARGRFVARMDAHALYPPDYLATGVRRLERGDVDYVTGLQLPYGVDAGSARIALALDSPLGVGGAGFRRRATEETETDAGFTGVWRRETLERLGGWREDWVVNEDGELAARLLKAGGRIVCVPEMAARYVPRRNLRALARQYWRYGQYRAKTCGRHPESMRRSHLVPPLVTLVVASSLLPRRGVAPLRIPVAGYALVLAAESARIARRAGAGDDALRLPAVFATMHLAWGGGFLAGCARFGVPVTAIRTAVRPRPAHSAGRLRVEPVEDLEALRDEWTTLGERTGNLFATWEWTSTWWEQLGGGRRLLIAACRDEAGALIGVLPLHVAATAGPLRLLRLIGYGHADRLGPICMPADRTRVAAALRSALRSPPWSGALVLAEHLPAEERWSALLGGRPLNHEASPLLELTTADWDEFLAERSTSLRKQVRYQERRLVREHDARFRLIEDAEALPGALDALFELHGTRWGGEGATDFAVAQRFHRAFAARALERGWLRLWLLEVDGFPVAAWHGFRFGGVDWHYQSGRDPAWDRYSVGAVLLAHTIRDCVEAGLSRYLFLRGNEPYKLRFATADHGLETIAIGTGVLGGAALLAADLARRLPPAGRRRISHVLRA
jgi:succinoglycan biosynthesis protein ExoA